MERKARQTNNFFDQTSLVPLRRWNQNTRKEERFGMAWGVQDSGLDDYSISFQSALGENLSLSTILEECATKPGRTSILDLMASTTAVRQAVVEYGINFGMAVSLGFSRRKHKDVGKKEVCSVNADITTRESWSKIRSQMRKNKVPSFDIILSRPIAGLDSRIYLPTLFYMFQEAWQLLTDNEGVMIFQFPTRLSDSVIEYFKKLNEVGIHVSWGDPDGFEVVRPAVIYKKETSPRILPSPKMLGIK